MNSRQEFVELALEQQAIQKPLIADRWGWIFLWNVPRADDTICGCWFAGCFGCVGAPSGKVRLGVDFPERKAFTASSSYEAG